MADNSLLNLLNQNGVLAFTTEQLLKAAGIGTASGSIGNLKSTGGEFHADGQGGWIFTPFTGWNGVLDVTFDLASGTGNQSYSTELGEGDVSVPTENVIQGSDRGDRQTGSDQDDVFVASAGNDRMDGGAGNDVFLVGEGDGTNVIKGGEGYDTIRGTSQDDRISLHNFTGDNRVEEIDGGAGRDTIAINEHADFSETKLTDIEAIEGSSRQNRITGSEGDDTIDGGAGADVLKGDAGDDTFLKRTGDGADRISGGEGFDRVVGTDGDDEISLHRFTGEDRVEEIDGGAGQDTISINEHADFSATKLTDIEAIEGSSRQNRITGSEGDDTIDGGDGADVLKGGAGDDTFVKRSGDGLDRISGGEGFDRIVASDSDDELAFHSFTGSDRVEEIDAGAGQDTISVYDHADFSETNLVGVEAIEGNARQNSLTGSQGDDVMDGGAGADRVRGEAGNDTLVFKLSENAGYVDRYDGGADTDILRLELTQAESQNPAITAEIIQFLQFLTGDAASNGESFAFSSMPLEVKNIEQLELFVDGVQVDLPEIPVANAAKPEPVNTAPEAEAVTLQMLEDGSLTFSEAQLLGQATDLDGDQLSLTSLTVDQGELTNNGDGSWTFTPAADWNGNVALNYGVSDGEAITQVQASIQVDAVNDAARLSGEPAFSMEEDGTLTLTADQLLAGATDVEGDALAVVGLTANQGVLTDNGNGTWSFKTGCRLEW